MDLHSNLTPYLGDVQLRAFSSFFNNHVQWERAFHTTSQNEANSNQWIQSEPQSPRLILTFQEKRLASPMKT